MNEQYGEYIGNIDLATASYNDLASALRSASEALIQKQIAEVYGERYQAQLRRVAELQVQYNDLMKTARENQSQFIQDREMLQGGPGDYWKLSPEGILNEQITQVRDNLNQAKGDLNDFAAAYRQALMELPDMSLGSAGNNGASSGNAQAESRRSEEERRLEQLRQLQQKYDVLAIDDAILRKQKEIEVQRDAELVKAQSLGASEELLQSIRDHYADESVRVETEAAEARTRQIEAETEERRKALEEERRQRQELSDMRFNFEQRSLDLAGQTWDAQLRAIDEYYARRREKLLEAGLTEEQITAQSEQAKAQIRNQYEMRNLQGAQQIMRDLAKTSEIFGKKGFAMWKTLAIGQAMIDTYASATAAYKAMAGIPIVGPGLAITAAAAAIGAGLANVAAIQATEPPKAETGGLLVGKSHNEGGILIEAEGDEYITAKDRVRALGRNLFDFLNFAPIEKVKLAFAGLPIPSVPIPQSIGSYYAAGGSISSGGTMNTLLEIMASMRDEIVSLKQTVMDSKSVIDIHVDPLSSDPVKVSEIADTGKMIRSEV